MQVKWSEQAVSEAENIVNYIAGHNIADFGKNAQSG